MAVRRDELSRIEQVGFIHGHVQRQRMAQQGGAYALFLLFRGNVDDRGWESGLQQNRLEEGFDQDGPSGVGIEK